MITAATLALMLFSVPGLDWYDVDGDGRNGRIQVMEERCIGSERNGWICLDQYTGAVFSAKTAGVSIDHIVPRKRLRSLPGAEERWAWRLMTNHPANLAITLPDINSAKGDRGPDKWCPLSPLSREWYAAAWKRAAIMFNLVPTEQELTGLAYLVKGLCPGGGEGAK